MTSDVLILSGEYYTDGNGELIASGVGSLSVFVDPVPPFCCGTITRVVSLTSPENKLVVTPAPAFNLADSLQHE